MPLPPSNLSLNSPLKALSPRAPQALCREIKSLGDILWVFPLEISRAPPLASFKSLREGHLFRGIGRILRYKKRPLPPRGFRAPPLHNLTLVAEDIYSPGILSLKWFNAYPALAQKLSSPDYLLFQGSVSVYRGCPQIINPEVEVLTKKNLPPLPSPGEKGALLTRYPRVNGVPGKVIGGIIHKIPDSLWDIPRSILPSNIATKRGFLSLGESFKVLHGKCPHWSRDLESRARERIIYQEFFQEQLKLSLRKQRRQIMRGVPIRVEEGIIQDHRAIFPYPLTGAQERAFESIRKDMTSNRPMMRLLQGDVGCGKTSVALLAILMALEAGYQCALMCPTESLACQHFFNLDVLLKPLNRRPTLLLGGGKSRERKDLLAGLGSGKIPLVIGTHALIQKSVVFHNLGLAVIDEQHKFGVNQRLTLLGKGPGCHCLIMTATPIPRSLRLTEYGDLDVSLIESMPPGRRGFKTRVVTEKKFRPFLSFMKTRLSMGEQAHLVVPAIEESEAMELESVAAAREEYSRYFPSFRLATLHGRMPSMEKQAIFQDFTAHRIDLLISTSVVEVGLDVPNATVMAILNPDRFGLCSLHQLRGRVGRGSKPGFCFLLVGPKVRGRALERCRILESCQDGFRLAEEDLKLRGEGDVLGTRQSGEKSPRHLANIFLHRDQLLWAREDMESLGPEQYSLLGTTSGPGGSEYIFHTV